MRHDGGYEARVTHRAHDDTTVASFSRLCGCERQRRGLACRHGLVPVDTALASVDCQDRFSARALVSVADAMRAAGGTWSNLDRRGGPARVIAYARRATVETLWREIEADEHRDARQSSDEVSTHTLDHRLPTAGVPRSPFPHRATLTFYGLGRPRSRLWVFRGNSAGRFSPGEMRLLRIFHRLIQEQIDDVTDHERAASLDDHLLRRAGLTDREIEVVALAAKGSTNDEIARALALSTSTVKTHLYRAYNKLDVRSRAELAHRYRGAVPRHRHPRAGL